MDERKDKNATLAATARSAMTSGPASPACGGLRRGKRFEDLSVMTQEVVIDVAKCIRCTREEIVEALND